MTSVSVVIPVWNRSEKIAATLDSVLAQTRAPLEILVVDDGSTDDTADFIRANYGDRVRLISQPNGGVARARNTGWRAARGEWIAFLDHDDEFAPDKLEVLAPFLGEKNGVVVSRWREIRESGETVRESPAVSAKNAFGWLFGWDNPIVSMSVPLVRRDVLEEIGGFDAACAPADDWDLWLRASRVTGFAFCDAVLTSYVLHDAQQRRDEKKMFRAVRRVLGKHPLELARRPLLLWWWLCIPVFARTLGPYVRFKNGERGALGAAWRAHPLFWLAPQWGKALARRVVANLRGKP